MNCPRCGTAFDSRATPALTAAICHGCRGVWLGKGELERAIRLFATERGVVLKTLGLLEGPSRATTLPCPECATVLQALTLRGVEVERCSSCRGVFLDAGEGRTIASRAVLASGEWDRAYQSLLQTVRTWATPGPEPWLFGAGDFPGSGQAE